MARPFDKPDIHAEINDRVNHVLAVADAHLQRQGREIPAVAGDHFRQDVVADRAAGVDADRAVVFAEQLFNFNRLLQQGQRARVQQAAMFVHHQPLPYPVEKLHAQLPFKIGQGRADGGLRERQHL